MGSKVQPSLYVEIFTIFRQQGLGCSICRGPDTRPGIFVQSTRPGGLAAESGIEPGDQVLDCNGVCLQRADFAEAVYLLKNQRRLDLLIRKGAASGKLFYNLDGVDKFLFFLQLPLFQISFRRIKPRTLARRWAFRSRPATTAPPRAAKTTTNSNSNSKARKM